MTPGADAHRVLTAALAHHLATAGLVRWGDVGPADAPGCWVEDLPEGPEQAVGIFTIEGRPSDPVHPWDYPRIRVLVRGPGDQSPRARPVADLAAAIHALCVETAQADWGIGTPDEVYVVVCDGTGPAYLGNDPNGRPTYSMTLDPEVMSTDPARAEV